MATGHDLAAAAPRWHKLHKRQAATTTARGRAAAATTSAATVARSGVANTATGAAATKTVATAPPTRVLPSSAIVLPSYVTTVAGLQSGYHPGYSGVPSASALASFSSSDSAASSSGSNTASASTETGTNSQPFLSQTALIGIIAGGAALVVILFATIGCCCYRKKKAKKDQAKWWKLNESQTSVAGGKGASGVAPAGLVRAAPSRGVESKEKDWGAGAGYGDEKSVLGARSAAGSAQGRQPGFGPRDASDLQSQRQELFASPTSRAGSPGQQSQRPQQNGQNPFLSRDDSNLSLSQYPPPRFNPSPVPSAAHTERSLYSHHSNSGSGFIVLDNQQAPAPSRPPRPSEVPSAYVPPAPTRFEQPDRRDTREGLQQVESRFREVMTGAVGRPNSDAVRDAEKERPKQLASERNEGRRKADTVMNFTDAYGETDASGGTDWDRAPLPAVEAPVARPPRFSSKQPSSHSPRAAAPPLPSQDSYFPPTPASDAGSFPPQARSAFASTSEPTRREPRYSSRVDSKPLRELEDILDSFAHDPRRTQPPLPADASSMRSNSVRSAVSQQTASPHHSRAQAPGIIPSSSSSSSLSAPGKPFGRYTTQHDSYHSHAGLIGSNSPIKSRSNIPLASPTLSSLSSSSDLTMDHPLTVPSRHKIFNPSNASSTLSSSDEAPPSPAVTQMVRKISIKKDNDAPIRLVRNASLQQHQHQQVTPRRKENFASSAEQDVYSQMGLDSSSPRSSDDDVPSFSHSPATTPTTPSSSSPHFGGGPLQRSQPALFDHQGFAPLSSHTADVNYKSATMSIYGMYDDDQALSDLKGLPMTDPRVSRHLEGLSLR